MTAKETSVFVILIERAQAVRRQNTHAETSHITACVASIWLVDNNDYQSMYMYYELIIIINVIGSVQVYILTLASKLIFGKSNFHAIFTTYK